MQYAFCKPVKISAILKFLAFTCNTSIILIHTYACLVNTYFSNKELIICLVYSDIRNFTYDLRIPISDLFALIKVDLIYHDIRCAVF